MDRDEDTNTKLQGVVKRLNDCFVLLHSIEACHPNKVSSVLLKMNEIEDLVYDIAGKDRP